MERKEPSVIDAEFEVVEPPSETPKRKWSPWPWDYHWSIDWRVVAVGVATSIALFIARMTQLSGN